MNFKIAVKGKLNHLLRNRAFKKVKDSTDRNIKRTIICNNCVGAMVLHDYGLGFNSPFVNLFIEPQDYLTLLNDLEYYCSPLSSIENISKAIGSYYPVGLLNGKIKIHFLHYNNFEDAVYIWRERCKRIDYKNLYIVFVQQGGCSDKMIHSFSKLPFINKVVLVNEDKRNRDQFVIPGFENQKTLGIITDYIGWNGKRFYDTFDWRAFLNLYPIISN